MQMTPRRPIDPATFFQATMEPIMFKLPLTSHRAASGLLSLALMCSLGCCGWAQAQTSTPATTPAVTQADPSAAPVAPVVLPTPVITPPAGDLAAANPYGLRAVWQQGDSVARGTLALLALMSLLSWYIIVAKVLEQRRLNAQALAAKQAFAKLESLPRRTEALSKTSPFRFIVDSALDAAQRYQTLAGQVDMNTWLSQDIVRSVATLQMRTQGGLSVLATVGSTAPFVGLFGTVWGIYNALVTIGVSGQASIDKVAGPVGEALIMTALGLAVAVPAVLGYNWLVRRNRVTLHAVKGFGSELHTQLLVEIDKSQRAAGSAQKPA
jgi:biopolymer transport protein ExbB